MSTYPRMTGYADARCKQRAADKVALAPQTTARLNFLMAMSASYKQAADRIEADVKKLGGPQR